MTVWIQATIAVVGGVIIGALAAWVTRRVLRSRSDSVGGVAQPAGTFLFWFFTFVGVVVGVGIMTPATFETVPAQVLIFLPRVLVAGLIILATWGLAAGLRRLLRAGISSASGDPNRALESGVRLFVLAIGAVFAVAQLGVDTTILTIIVAGLVVFAALSAALLVGLGGRTIASEIAAGRYLARHLSAGDSIVTPQGESTVVSTHPAMIELEDRDGERRLVPYSVLLASGFTRHGKS
jgi:hypothetical protein